MSWLCSRALVEGYLEARSLDGEPCAPSSVICTRHPFSWRDKTTDICRLSQFGVTYEVLTAGRGEDLLTWFRAGFRANHSPSPESVPEPLTAANCSGKLFAVYKKSDPNVSFSKMSQDSSPVNPLLAYVGGLIDGEGCIRIQKQHKKKNYIPIVQITMADKAKPLLEQMTEYFGGRLYAQGYPNQENWSSQTMWRINGVFAVEFLRKIRPFLVLKLEQCDLALSLHELKERDGWNASTRKRAAQLKTRMHELNQRGVVRNVGGFYDPMPNLFGTWERFSSPLPNWGLMQSGELWERTMPGLRTEGNGSGYWPTPINTEARQGLQIRRDGAKGTQISLSTAVKQWPTPVQGDATGSRGRKGKERPDEGGLSKAVKQWPTPDAHCWKSGPRGNGTGGGEQLSAQSFPTPTNSMMTCADMEQARYSGSDPNRPKYRDAKENFPTPQAYSSGESNTPGLTKLDCAVRGLYPTPRTPSRSGGGIGLDGGAGARSMMTEAEQSELCRGQLNPMWVEWLMGWPIGWTGLEPLETGRYREWLDSHG